MEDADLERRNKKETLKGEESGTMNLTEREKMNSSVSVVDIGEEVQ